MHVREILPASPRMALGRPSFVGHATDEQGPRRFVIGSELECHSWKVSRKDKSISWEHMLLYKSRIKQSWAMCLAVSQSSYQIQIMVYVLMHSCSDRQPSGF